MTKFTHLFIGEKKINLKARENVDLFHKEQIEEVLYRRKEMLIGREKWLSRKQKSSVYLPSFSLQKVATWRRGGAEHIQNS